MQKLYTDYPFTALGDGANEKAPIRPVQVLSFDGDKYCHVIVNGVASEIKAGYIYTTPGRSGEVPCFDPSSTDFPTMNCDYDLSLSLRNNQPMALVLTNKGHSTVIPARMLKSKRLFVSLTGHKEFICPGIIWLKNHCDSALAQLHQYPSFCSITEIELIEEES